MAEIPCIYKPKEEKEKEVEKVMCFYGVPVFGCLLLAQ